MRGTTGVGIAMLGFADFYALMPTNNPRPIPPGSDVVFPNDGPTNGTIPRVSATQFMLPAVGTYLVQFHFEVIGASQLVITLNNVEQPSTVRGDAEGVPAPAQGMLVTTAAANTVLTIRNPAANSLYVSPAQQSLADGFSPTSAHLVITRYA